MIRRLIITVCTCMLSASSVRAIDFISTNNYQSASNDVIQTESWIYAQTGRVSGVVSDDIFMLTDQLDLSGRFEQDIWAIATRADFSGDCAASARLIGQQVLVSGRVANTLTAVGQTVKCAQSATAGEMLLIGSDVIIDGGTEGNARIIANRVTLDGQFKGDVRLIASDIVVSSGCRIAGDLIYTSPKELFLPNKSIVSGKLVRKADTGRAIDTKKLVLATITAQTLWFFGALLVGLPLVSLYPLFTVMTVKTLKTSTWRCLYVGLISFFLVPLFVVFIVGSIIGIPLALILASLYGILLYLSKYPIAMLLGILILRQRRTTNFRGILLILILGLAAIYILTALPYIGGTIRFVITVYGLGALITNLAAARKTVLTIDASAIKPATDDKTESSAPFET